MTELPKAGENREKLRLLLANQVAAGRNDQSAHGESTGGKVQGSVIQLRPGCSRPPLVCVHGGGAGIVSYRRLVERLPAEQPVLGLQLQGLRPDDPINRSIERMAELHVAALRAEYPVGPYCLCGHSMGAVVALEIAQQLIRLGQEVPLLIVIDQPGPDIHMTAWHWLYWQWISVAHLPWRQRWRYVVNGARYRIRSRPYLPRWFKRLFVSNRGKIASDGSTPKPSLSDFRLNMMEASIQALKDYRPQSFPSEMVLIRAKSSAPRIHGDPFGGWGKVSQGRIQVFDIPGHHMNIFESPNLELLAARIAERLAQCHG